MGGLGRKPQLPITSAHVEPKSRYLKREILKSRQSMAPVHLKERICSSWHWVISLRVSIPHYFMHISTFALPLPLLMHQKKKEWRCNTSAEKLSTHFRSMLGSTINFYRKHPSKFFIKMFRNKWIQRIKWKYKDINIKCFLCFPFWMCQIFYRRANNITISEALYSWYPGDSAPLLSSDWSMF